MLDLNLGMLSTHNEDDNDFQVPTSMFDQQQDSINLSKNDSSLITFGILKRKEDVELLPPPPDSELSDESEWLKLSSMQRNNEEMFVATKKNRRGPRSRSSHYRGVTLYRRTGRWESHIWDCGKQVYLGGFESAYTAARAYDRAAIRFRGLQADINFIVDDYKHDIEKMKNLSKKEVVQTLRRECASLPRRGSSKYNHFTLHNQTHHVNYDHIHLFQNRRWNGEAAAKCNEMRKIEDIKIGAHNKGNEHNNLELSLGTSSSSEDIRLKTSDYLLDATLADRSWVTPNKVPFHFSPWKLSL